MASLVVDFSKRESQVYVESTVTMDVILPEPSEGWSHILNGVSGSDMKSLFLGAVDINSVVSINGVE